MGRTISDSADTYTHARWHIALIGMLGLLVLVPTTLDEATRDLNVQCVRALGKGECTIRLGWLLHSTERTISIGELQGASSSCGERKCVGVLELITGEEPIGRVDSDTFTVFADTVDGFLDDPTQSHLDVSLGPARMSWMLLAAYIIVGLGLTGTFEYSELRVDQGAQLLTLRSRGLLQWADLEYPLPSIAAVQVERLRVKNDREEPNAIVSLRLVDGTSVRVGRSGDASAEALAGWLRARLGGRGPDRRG